MTASLEQVVAVLGRPAPPVAINQQSLDGTEFARLVPAPPFGTMLPVEVLYELHSYCADLKYYPAQPDLFRYLLLTPPPQDRAWSV